MSETSESKHRIARLADPYPLYPGYWSMRRYDYRGPMDEPNGESCGLSGAFSPGRFAGGVRSEPQEHWVSIEATGDKLNGLHVFNILGYAPAPSWSNDVVTGGEADADLGCAHHLAMALAVKRKRVPPSC